MIGIIFCELLKMIEAKYGLETVDFIVESKRLKSKGAYTTIGVYSVKEFIQIMSALSEINNTNIQFEMRSFGEYLIEHVLVLKFPYFFEKHYLFSFLECIESYVHLEVNKLYQTDNLPRFKTKRLNQNEIHMIYNSDKPLADFVEGLILGASRYFKEPIQIVKQDLDGPDGTNRKFMITKENS